MSMRKTIPVKEIMDGFHATSAIGSSAYRSSADPTNLSYIMANNKTVRYNRSLYIPDRHS
jgi:hypothetical protein